MSRVALGLAYDGSAWQGWQTQPHGQTVQDTLERVWPGAVPTICAGRTDTRVHGAMQVVHLDTALDRRMERGVNAFLPVDLRAMGQAGSGRFPCPFLGPFAHLRLSAWRRVRPALWAGRAGWCFQPLDGRRRRRFAGRA